MTLTAQCVRAVFWETIQYSEPSERIQILDRECRGNSALRGRIETFLKAHDEFNDFVNRPMKIASGHRV
jgi:hypothetical protein